MESNVILMLPAPHDDYLPAMPLLRGDIYRYENEECGKDYVGATKHVERRRADWNCQSSNYAGSKIAAARKNTPPDKWGYYSFPVFDTDPDILDQRLKEYETYYIAYYDSYENGYNGNRGGAGRPATVIIKVTASTGDWRLFTGYREVGEAFGLTTGGIQRYVDKKADHTNKDGFKFERLN